MIVNIDMQFEYSEDAVSSVNAHLAGLLSDGYKYIYKNGDDCSVYYYESFDKYTGERSKKIVKISGIYLSRGGTKANEVSEVKLIVSSEPISQRLDIEADSGYLPYSPYTQKDRSYNIEGLSPHMYTELVNGKNEPRWTVGPKRNWVECAIVTKGASDDSLGKKSGWALVKYEEVDAPE